MKRLSICFAFCLIVALLFTRYGICFDENTPFVVFRLDLTKLPDNVKAIYEKQIVSTISELERVFNFSGVSIVLEPQLILGIFEVKNNVKDPFGYKKGAKVLVGLTEKNLVTDCEIFSSETGKTFSPGEKVLVEKVVFRFQKSDFLSPRMEDPYFYYQKYNWVSKCYVLGTEKISGQISKEQMNNLMDKIRTKYGICQ